MKQTSHKLIDPKKWQQKAMAFAIRSHRHLWGKNNEAPLAFLFNQGFKNDFIKKLYMGWNKFGQVRPIVNWGFEPVPDQGETFVLPSGVVVPVIENKVLISLFIQQFNENELTDLVLIPGSGRAAMVLGDDSDDIVILNNLFDGLYLFQEIGDHCQIVICPDRTQPHDSEIQQMLKRAAHIICAMKKGGSRPQPVVLHADRKMTELEYQTKQELVSLILSG